MQYFIANLYFLNVYNILLLSPHIFSTLNKQTKNTLIKGREALLVPSEITGTFRGQRNGSWTVCRISRQYKVGFENFYFK